VAFRRIGESIEDVTASAHEIADAMTEVGSVAEQSTVATEQVSASMGRRPPRRSSSPPPPPSSPARPGSSNASSAVSAPLRDDAQACRRAADERETMTEQVLAGLREPETEDERVAFWRFLVLVHAGYPRPLARQLAVRGSDLHRATALLAAGCPPPLALRILL
jgi:hypothetical protein